MIHQFQGKNKRNRKKKVLSIFIIVIAFGILVFSGILPILGKLFNNIGHPILQAKVAVKNSTNNINYDLKSRSSLINDIKNLSEENSNLRISMIDYQLLKDQNTKLKNILNRAPAGKKLVVASILSKPSESPYDTIIIDVGKSNGVKSGDKVYVNSTIPIGTVREIYSKTSMVELYSNPGRVTSGVVNGLDLSVDLVGRGGGNFEMSVPFKITIPEGTLIKLPGILSEVVAVTGGDITDTTDQNRKIILHGTVNIQNQSLVEVEK